jgi:hypothetical protein
MSASMKKRMQSAARYAVTTAMAVAFSTAVSNTAAHSASDAYLTLEASSPSGGESVVRAQWDIALRDLDFVLGLDADGDGVITWRELRERQEAVARYAYGFVSATAGGKACALRPVHQRVANHADGAYAALIFDIACPGSAAKVKLDYRAFFAVDPSHRCILVMRSRGEAATALLSPQNASVDLKI